EDGIRDDLVTGVQTCALPISHGARSDRGRMPTGRCDSRRGLVNAERVEELIAALDRGEARVAEPDGDEWRVNVEAQEAILEYFQIGRASCREGVGGGGVGTER